MTSWACDVPPPPRTRRWCWSCSTARAGHARRGLLGHRLVRRHGRRPTPEPLSSQTRRPPRTRPGWRTPGPAPAGRSRNRPPLVGTGRFTDRTDVLPGEPVRLFVSTTRRRSPSRASGWVGTAAPAARAVWASERLPRVRQPAPTTSALGTVSAADWQPSVTLPTASWPPGDYLLRLDGADHRPASCR